MKKSSIILKEPIDKGKRPCYNEYKFKGIEQDRCNGRKDEVIMKYFVIATHWDDKRKAQVKYIAGEFSSYMNANIFKEAYNAHYMDEQEKAFVVAAVKVKIKNDKEKEKEAKRKSKKKGR